MRSHDNRLILQRLESSHLWPSSSLRPSPRHYIFSQKSRNDLRLLHQNREWLEQTLEGIDAWKTLGSTSDKEL